MRLMTRSDGTSCFKTITVLSACTNCSSARLVLALACLRTQLVRIQLDEDWVRTSEGRRVECLLFMTSGYHCVSDNVANIVVNVCNAWTVMIMVSEFWRVKWRRDGYGTKGKKKKERRGNKLLSEVKNVQMSCNLHPTKWYENLKVKMWKWIMRRIKIIERRMSKIWIVKVYN